MPLEGQSFRILVVDDYEPWRRFVASTLQNQPGLLIVGEAADGSSAVEKAQELRPDLILLDIGLPALNGIEAARQIRKLAPKSKILFTSENRSWDIAEEALHTGALGYVVKSDAVSELLPAVTAVLQAKRFVSRRFAEQDFAKLSDACSAHEPGHVVQFYPEDAFLLDGLSALLCNSLGAGESVVAVTTRSHRRGLERRLPAQGVDVDEATKIGRLVILDADQALSGFMDAVLPSRERFLSQFENMLRKASAAAVVKNQRVVVFGEMVAVLWSQERHDAALRLEELWNELALIFPFYLCCAYPASAFGEKLKGGGYSTICALHSGVVSAFE